MRRDKAWWARLSKAQRSELVALEKANKRVRSSSMLPDGINECASCTGPSRYGGLCMECYDRLQRLRNVASGEQMLGEWPPGDLKYRNPENPECPRCWSSDIGPTGEQDFWSNEGWREIECNECYYQWDQLYTIVGLRTVTAIQHYKKSCE